MKIKLERGRVSMQKGIYKTFVATHKTHHQTDGRFARIDRSLGGIVEGAEDVIVSVDEKFLLVSEGDFAAAVLGEEHSVANLHEGCTDRAVLERLAGSSSNDSAEVELLVALAGGEDNAGLGFGLSHSLLDDDTVEEGAKSSEREHDLLYEWRFLLLNFIRHSTSHIFISFWPQGFWVF